MFSDRRRRDLERGRAYDEVAPMRRLTNRRELRGNGALDHRPALFGCQRPRTIPRPGRRSKRGPDRHDLEAEPFDPFAKVGRHTQARIVPERAQLARECYQGLNLSARSDRGQQRTHRDSPGRKGPSVHRDVRLAASHG